MKYKIILLITVLSLFLIGCVGVWQYDIEHYYDEFDGYTTDKMTGNNIHYGSNPIWLNAQRYIPKSGIRLFDIVIETARFNWLFIEDGNSLTLMLDGEIMRFTGDGSKDYREVREVGIYETAYYRITEDQLRIIANSKEIKLKLVGNNGIVTETCAGKVVENFKKFVNDYVNK